MIYILFDGLKMVEGSNLFQCNCKVDYPPLSSNMMDVQQAMFDDSGR